MVKIKCIFWIANDEGNRVSKYYTRYGDALRMSKPNQHVRGHELDRAFDVLVEEKKENK